MKPTGRKFGQGVGNIVRFNWPFYALALGGLLAGALLRPHLAAPWHGLAGAALALGLLTTLASLAVSAWVYDVSGLYQLGWLPALPPAAHLVNINAGFDETSALLRATFPAATLTVLDFYDPARHTEASIGRARRAYPPYPGTVAVPTTALPLPPASADAVLAVLAAHEVRDEAERVAFFREIGRVLKPGGQVVVVEHLRDLPNFLAYTVGFLHFHSRATWQRTFRAAGLRVAHETKVTPFLTVFTLRSDGASA